MWARGHTENGLDGWLQVLPALTRLHISQCGALGGVRLEAPRLEECAVESCAALEEVVLLGASSLQALSCQGCAALTEVGAGLSAGVAC